MKSKQQKVSSIIELTFVYIRFNRGAKEARTPDLLTARYEFKIV